MGSGVLIDTAIRLLAALALVVANAGSVAAEFALVAVDRARIDERAGQGQARAAAVQRLLSRLSYHLSGAQLGITITSLLLGVLAEPAVARVLEPGIEAAFGEVPTGVSVAIALAVATVVQMIFGELIPKAIATTRPLETSLAMARPTQLYGVVADGDTPTPFVAGLFGLAIIRFVFGFTYRFGLFRSALRIEKDLRNLSLIHI